MEIIAKCAKNHGIITLLFGIFLLVFDKPERTWICEVCNSFCFWYNEDTKRAELELDSNVAR